ncbi:2408_t:CDS:2, partial [Cetraspora pellucida]
AAQGSMNLDNFFKPVKKLEVKYEMSNSDINDLDIKNNSSISKKINKLSNNLKDMKNMNTYEYLCLLAMHKYLAAIFNHEESHSHVKLSLKILQQVFQHGKDKALMISEFLTKTHDHFTITFAEINELNLPPTFPQKAHIIIKLEKNDDSYQPKSIQQVLRECNLWPTSGLKLKCKNNYYDPSAPNCCAHHLLSAQPDFIMQKLALEELIVE